MSLSDVLFTLLIGPLKTLFEIIYIFAYKMTSNPGLSIVGLSLVMNLILLPLYNRTDAIQMEAIETEKRLKPVVSHIKKTFKGNEQFMMLQTCYRQNHYKPTDAVKGISPLLLEIPFFMAAYNYLSGLSLLDQASLGPIANLAAPDGLLALGSLQINVLPIAMTVINVLSSLIYTKDAPLKTKLQLYGMAALFLVLLYDAPAGLALYWTLNNLFSLIKNMIMRTRNPMKTTAIGATAVSLPMLLFGWGSCVSGLRKLALLLVFLTLNGPMLFLLAGKYLPKGRTPLCETNKADRLSFLCASLIMTVLVGVLIPSAVVRTSPEEFMIPGMAMNPNLRYVGYSALLAAGTFLVWLSLFFAMASPGWKRKMVLGMWILAGAALVDYMCFGRNYGNMSSKLIFDDPIHPGMADILRSGAVLLAVVLGILLIRWKKRELLTMAGTAVLIAMVCMSAMNLMGSQKIIASRLDQIWRLDAAQDQAIHLSKKGKNVVVLMMDRAVNSFVPYIFNEKPELRQQFAGFTYYPNTLSFGGHTNFGLPAVFGGYEYMPAEMNKRDTVLLKDKHNEALRLMPVLFDENGFQVTVCDPTYAGYNEIPDLSIFDEYPDIETAITMLGYHYDGEELAEVISNKMYRYSIMRVSPVFLQSVFYDSGRYLYFDSFERKDLMQIATSNLTASGRDTAFDASWNVLSNLPEMTEIRDDSTDTFLMMCNDLSHSPAMLQLPDYVPSRSVDNRALEEDPAVRRSAAGDEILLENERQAEHYHCNAASYIQIGKWLDYLRENDVYDNTRIIIVSDHGMGLGLHQNWIFDSDEVSPSQDHRDIMYYNPVLLVKDFGSSQLTTDDTFMTNADVPTLAFRDLVEQPVNPFTGTPVSDALKYDGKLYVSLSDHFSVGENCGTRFIPDPWAWVSGDVLDPQNWHAVADQEVS